MRKLVMAVVVLSGGAALFAGEFKAGFSRTDITPPLGVYMPGYFKARHAKSVLDPLQVNCVAFSDGAKTALVMQIDTVSLSDGTAGGMRDAVVKATGVDRDAILLHASHTHDGGLLRDSNGEPLTDLYIKMATSRVADAAVEAIRDLRPARLSYQRSHARRISFGRRYKMKDGKVRTNPGTNNPDIVGPAGNPPDEEVQVLRIDRDGGKPICMINFQTHPDVVGGETITADWPGLTRAVFEAATFGAARCIVINGAQGDVNHCNVMPRPGELNGLRRDFDAVDRGYDHAKHMANVLASAALSVWMKCVPLDSGEIRFATSTVRVPAHKAKDGDEKNLAWANDVCELHDRAMRDGVAGTEKDYVTAKYGWKDMELTTEVARAGRIRRMAKHADFHDLPLYAVAIGRSVAFGGFPGEPFNDIGKAVKKNSPFALTILSCLTNGSRGYFPFSDAYVGGGYESATSPFGPSVADDLIKGEGALLDRLYAESRRGGAFDVVVYGSSPAAISAAIQARRMGMSAVVVSPETRIGGLTTGGLGQTDIGNKSAFGGIALEFYKAVADYYSDAANWTRQKPESYFPDGQCAGSKGRQSMWTFEPSAALKILEGWERRDGLDIRRGEWLDRENGVAKQDGRIVSMKTLSGNVYSGKVFVDATYEGDLMAAAGVSYTVGREANSVYGETLNGNQPAQAKFHQLNVGVDPYVVSGDPGSGLLFGVEPYDPAMKPGDGDRRVQAYCFRMCLTDDPENRIPFAKPEGYDERDYELLFRHLAIAPLDRSGMPWINSKMPNRKTDTNNRTGFATDFIGQNWRWPEASYAEREKIRAAHLKYQRGLMWTLANHPRVPEKIRNEVARWGTCRDEFQDGLGDGWQTQLYVREARRMVGEYVMTEHNCWGTAVAPRAVAMGAYQMDSHHVRRYVGADGFVHNEGDVEVKFDAKTGKRFKPYPIDYGAVLPKRVECTNLIVPVCLSASHIAFGSIRMEPVFFALGQVAGTAGSIAAAKGIAVQDVPYGELSARLVADGQVIALPK